MSSSLQVTTGGRRPSISSGSGSGRAAEWQKAHIGVDAETGLVHGAGDAGEHARWEAGALLHGGEEEVWADAGYRGTRSGWTPSGAVACGDETGAAAAPGAGRGAVAARAGQGFGAGKGGAPVPVCEAASVIRYRGLAKNMERIALLLGFANLLVAGRYSTA